MARKATLDHGSRPGGLAADEFAGDGATPGATLPAGPGSGRRQSGGAGGRWLVWLGRAVIWAVLLIIGFRGVMSIFTGDHQSAGSGTGSAAAGKGFPTTLAEAFALQFGQVYLNFNPSAATQRATALAPFIPVGASPQFGWNGTGTQSLQSEQVASVSVSSAHQATITILASITNGIGGTGLVELGVPVYADHGGLVVSAEPAVLPGPDRASPPPAPKTAADQKTQSDLASQLLPGFFRAYATGDQQELSRYVVPGVHLTGLAAQVTFSSLASVLVPAGGTTRQIAVSVIWQLPAPPPPPPATPPPTSSKSREREPTPSPTPTAAPTPPLLQTTYDMTVVRQHGTWYVKAIGTSAQQPGGS
jgi:hypothetical protein